MEHILFPSLIAPNSTPEFYIVSNNVKFRSLLDTGASLSFMHVNVAQKCNVEFLSCACPRIVIGNDSHIIPVGLCLFTFSIASVTYTHHFYLLDNCPFDTIFGVDFISQNNIIIDIARGNFYFSSSPNRRVKFQNRDFLCALTGLNEQRKAELDSLLHEFPDVLSNKVGCTNLVECKFEVTGDPVAQKPYKCGPFKRAIITKHIQDMLQGGIIRPSKSEWASPVTLQKQNGEYRFCLDYRRLNKATKSDPFPIPRIEDLISKLGEARFISKIDLKKGYWQVKMHDSSIEQTAFISHDGKFEFTRMPFGPKTAPSIFQRLINRILGAARGVFAEGYLDDLLVFSKTWKEHLQHLKFVLNRLREAGMTANTDKCSFAETRIKYLGFVITPDGVQTDPEKLDPIRLYAVPKTPKEVKRFLGMCGWYRHFISHFSQIAEPLNGLLRHDCKFHWSDTHQTAFESLKAHILKASALRFPDFSKPFTLRTDSSDVGLGAVISQTNVDG